MSNVPDFIVTEGPSLSCPFCHQPMRLWRERFKGNRKALVRASHVNTASADCNATARGGVESATGEKRDEGE